MSSAGPRVSLKRRAGLVRTVTVEVTAVRCNKKDWSWLVFTGNIRPGSLWSRDWAQDSEVPQLPWASTFCIFIWLFIQVVATASGSRTRRNKIFTGLSVLSRTDVPKKEMRQNTNETGGTCETHSFLHMSVSRHFL